MASNDNGRFLPLGILHSIAKPLIKLMAGFMNACKGLMSFLKTPFFFLQHSKNVSDHNNPFILIHKVNEEDSPSCVDLVHPFSYTIEDIGLPFVDEKSEWKIIESCNGVICLQLQLTGDFYLWNPVNRQVHEVPSVLTLSERSIYLAGFGYSSELDDYKIVVLKTSTRRCVHVYSFNTDVWTEIEGPDYLLEFPFYDFLSGTASNDGNIFWGAIYDVLSFDIVSEVFRRCEFNLGPPYSADGISVYNNLLAIQMRAFEHYLDPFVEVWRMERVVNEVGSNLRFTSVCKISNDGSEALCICRNEIFFLHIKDDLCKFRLYNFTNHEETWLDCPDNDSRWEAFSFEKTLVSIAQRAFVI